MCKDANYNLGEDMTVALEESKLHEKSAVGRDILTQILENAEIAREEKMPMCQDTGVAVFFVELGYECQIVGGDIYEAIDEGVRLGYEDGYIRFSMVADAIKGVTTSYYTTYVKKLGYTSGINTNRECN